MVGLIATNASFLTTAVLMEGDHWGRNALIVASIANVPLFLLALFVLQTKFRAELQEDTYYSDYLSKKSTAVVRLDKNAAQDAKIEALEKQLTTLSLESVVTPVVLSGDAVHLDWIDWAVALNVHHPEFNAIRRSLKDAGIPLSELFGKTSGKPEKWIISIDRSMPFTHKVKLLDVLVPFGFDGFLFWNPAVDADENENVYIGSYGGGRWTAITSELGTLLAGGPDPIDLKAYMAAHRRTSD